MQLDFVEMLRVRDEKRRMRHVEILRQQKEEEDDPEGSGRGGDEGGVSLALLGGLDEEKDSVFNPQPPVKTSTSSKTKTTTESRQVNCLEERKLIKTALGSINYSYF